MRRSATYLSLLLLGLAGACGSAPTSPEDILPQGLGFAPLPDLSAFANETPDPTNTNAPPPAPLLHRLAGMAIGVVRERHGPEPADQMMQALRARHEALRAAVEAGNLEAAREARAAVDQLSARIVLHVFGPPIVARVMHAVATQIERVTRVVNEAEANGRDVAGPRRVLAHVTALLQGARAAAEAGNPMAALLRAAHASDVIHTVFGGRQP